MAKKMSAADKTARDKDLCRDRARGLTWEKVAERYSLTERQCRNIWDDFAKREKATINQRDPIMIVWETAERYEQWIEQAAEIALTTNESDAVRLTALNTQMRLQEKQTELLQQAGILPRDLGKLRVEMDVRFIIKQVIRVFRERGVPVDVQKEILELVAPSSN